MPAYRHLFGPVSSRRFGRSLGVDLVRPKTCTLNCVFCQLGPTPATQVERSAEVPVAEILAELAAWHRAGGQTDFITLGGSGEPTLHPELGAILAWVRDNLPFRSLLLSNGTLFTQEDVRHDAAQADVVKVSLHAWDQASFERLTRPHPTLRLDAILEGYRRFRSVFRGRLHVEVFVVPGINDRPEQMARVARLAASFRPDVIQLNTIARPPAESSVQTVPPAALNKLAALFTPLAEIPQDAAPTVGALLAGEPDADALVALVRRHPASAEQLAGLSNRSVEAVLCTLKALAAQERIHLLRRDGVWFAAPP